MLRVTKTHRCLSRTTPFAASAALLRTALIASIVPLLERKPYWLGDKPSVTKCATLLRISRSRIFSALSSREMGLYELSWSTGFVWPLWRRTILAVFHSMGKDSELRQVLKARSRGEGFYFTTAERTSFITPSGSRDFPAGNFLVAILISLRSIPTPSIVECVPNRRAGGT